MDRHHFTQVAPHGPSPCRGISAGILPMSLAQISSIYRLTDSFMAIQDGLQWFVSITDVVLNILYRCYIDMHLICTQSFKRDVKPSEKNNNNCNLTVFPYIY